MLRRNIFLTMKSGQVVTKMVRDVPKMVTSMEQSQVINRYLARSNPLQKFLISDSYNFNQKLEKFKKDGLHNLQIISDFDRTLSKGWIGKQKCHYTYEILQKSSFVSEQFTEQCDKLRKFYIPLEQDPSIPISAKQKLMEEWAEKGQQLLMNESIYDYQLEDMIHQSNIMLRYGFVEFCEFLEENNVDLFIVSAGLANFIDVLLRDKLNIGWLNTHIAGNFLIFDNQTGKIKDYTKPFITASNKEMVLNLQQPMLKYKKNIIVLGDNIEVFFYFQDTRMANHTGCEETIKIGYFNHSSSEKELLESFKQKFDIVILNDGDIKFITNLLKLIDGQISTLDMRQRYYPFLEVSNEENWIIQSQLMSQLKQMQMSM